MLLGQYLPTVEVCQIYHTFDQQKPRKGLSEKLIRRKLEKSGWTVWRGGLLNITDQMELYPNVRKKYDALLTLLRKYRPGAIDELRYLCQVHHGMPDFLCYRNGQFKFIECKLGYESLSKAQKLCVSRLQCLGFPVEVHRLAEPQTLIRAAVVNLRNGKKRIRIKQRSLKERL